MSWLYECIGVVIALSSLFLHAHGFHYLYFPDAILMFVVIPVVHLLNDEDTKTVVTEQGWIQGVKHMFITELNSAKATISGTFAIK